ncbi:transmembrane prolyl 4-hydroxylase-like [Haliotis rufescens]|uniref:transmembrane prolyl 4-hydroxylase-like n=1 Tax=Haliotis rufescens TaxID=6454 RepID=UPI00201E7B8B|nr:transmembrane prolyl 4-hydroxylase-like [Haliotis rufescens]XP_048253399.1 transmembrane prolyl 4-hydroxylase-like [Haliotis rufescens]
MTVRQSLGVLLLWTTFCFWSAGTHAGSHIQDSSCGAENDNPQDWGNSKIKDHQTDQCLHRESRTEQLTRLDPVKVGHVELLNLMEGKVHERITLALNPPVFEIRDFLSSSECSYIRQIAMKNGLKTSGLFTSAGQNTPESHTSARDLRDFARVSMQTYVHLDHDPILKGIRERLSAVTRLSLHFFDDSEGLQVVRYGVGGHYHAHMDSGPEMAHGLPCCHQSRDCHPATSRCCQLCRYVTVLLYLNQVEEGGETAFPIADQDTEALSNLMSKRENFNLSHNCHNSSVVIKPQEGMAVMWYNNHLDTETGWIGDLDPFSYHGGCDVLRGEKWIANCWVSASTFSDKHKPSIYASRWN